MASDLEMTSADFDARVLESDAPVLIDFWASWCRPCLAIAPSVEQIAAEYSGKAKVYKIDVDAEPALAERFGIMNIPALVVFKGGKIVDQLVGSVPKAAIAALLDRTL